jgi:hypothetical protein
MTEQTLDQFISLLEKNAGRSLKNDEIQIIMMWSETCGHCQAQFKYWSRPASHEPGNEGMGMNLVEYEKLLKLRDLFGDEAVAWQMYQHPDVDVITQRIVDTMSSSAKTSGKEVDGSVVIVRAGKEARKLFKDDEYPLTKAGLDNIVVIANRILPIEVATPMGQRLIKEAQAFADKVRSFNSQMLKKPDDYLIKFTPSWIDFVTHENYGFGHHSERQIRDMLNLNSLSSRRQRFKTLHSQVMNQECDAVACGIGERIVKIDPKQTRRSR